MVEHAVELCRSWRPGRTRLVTQVSQATGWAFESTDADRQHRQDHRLGGDWVAITSWSAPAREDPP